MGLLNFTLAALESSADKYPFAKSIGGGPPQRPTFKLAESRLRGDVLGMIKPLLRRLGYRLEADSKPIKNFPGHVELAFHRLETKDGSVSLVQLDAETLRELDDWERVQLLLNVLAEHGLKSVFVFTEGDEVNRAYSRDTWPTFFPKPPHLFDRVAHFDRTDLQDLHALDPDHRAEQLRKWMSLPDVPPPDPDAGSDGFHQPEDLRRTIANMFIALGEYPFDEVFRGVMKKLPRDVIPESDFQQRTRQLVDAADRAGWLRKLVYGVWLTRADDEVLAAIAERFQLLSSARTQKEVDAMLADPKVQLSPAVFRSRQGRREVQVCRVELAGKASGTGFLVGPDLVLTNYHVVEPVLDETAASTRLRVRFDHKIDENESELHPGHVVKAAAKWKVHASRYNDDEKAGLVGVVPTDDQLDYALIRLAVPVGSLPVGGATDDVDARPRGWIHLPEHAKVDPDDTLMILQHPGGVDLRMTMDTDGVIGLNDPTVGTRLRYKTKTLPGSSGAPCFDAEWRIVALHHLGDSTFAGFDSAGFQQGVPIGKILDSLERHGHLGELPADPP